MLKWKLKAVKLMIPSFGSGTIPGCSSWEGIEFCKVVTLSSLQLHWFMDSISELLHGPFNRLLLRNSRNGSGAMRISKFCHDSG